MTDIIAKTLSLDYDEVVRVWGVIEVNLALKAIVEISGNTARNTIINLDDSANQTVIKNMDGLSARKSIARDYLLELGPRVIMDSINEVLYG